MLPFHLAYASVTLHSRRENENYATQDGLLTCHQGSTQIRDTAFSVRASEDYIVLDMRQIWGP